MSDQDDNKEHATPTAYRTKVREFVELHDQVQTSVTLLDSLESFLSTFQKDLQAVSGQISELQDKSKDIENRLKSRRKIEKPLSSLVSDITISPQLATIILDKEVGEPWVTAITDFERRLVMVKSRTRVKSARDLGEVAEGLRIVQLSFGLFFGPLPAYKKKRYHEHASHPDIRTTEEVRRAYVGSARVYYETGFRRYVRSLGYVKARTSEKFDLITSTEPAVDAQVNFDRLAFSKLEGPAVMLSYMADDKAHREPVEALLRSLFLVFMDNSTAEYTFIKSFFGQPQSQPLADVKHPTSTALTPRSPDRLSFADEQSNLGSEDAERTPGVITTPNVTSFPLPLPKKDQESIDLIWKQVMEPVLEYCQTFVNTILEAVPSIISLLIMIRLIEEVVVEIQRRQCPPVETYVFAIRLQMWPMFQKLATDNVEALKKLAEGSSASYFSRAPNTTETLVTSICYRYIVIFNSFIHLTNHEEETMIFANLLRLRQELSKLITRHTNQIVDAVSKAMKQASIYQAILQGLSKGTKLTAHPKLQQELAYWSNLEEEVSRKIVSMGQSRSRP